MNISQYSIIKQGRKLFILKTRCYYYSKKLSSFQGTVDDSSCDVKFYDIEKQGLKDSVVNCNT